jgi:uncharacterized protein (DUF3820 family)
MPITAINRKKPMIMHLGKYQGFEIADIPSDYLKWMLINFDSESCEELLEEVQDELAERDRYSCHFYGDDH